jgi:hypothetical protein
LQVARGFSNNVESTTTLINQLASAYDIDNKNRELIITSIQATAYETTDTAKGFRGAGLGSDAVGVIPKWKSCCNAKCKHLQSIVSYKVAWKKSEERTKNNVVFVANSFKMAFALDRVETPQQSIKCESVWIFWEECRTSYWIDISFKDHDITPQEKEVRHTCCFYTL